MRELTAAASKIVQIFFMMVNASTLAAQKGVCTSQFCSTSPSSHHQLMSQWRC